MEFVFLFVHPQPAADAPTGWPWAEGTRTPGPIMAAMNDYAAELRRRGVLLAGAPLHSAASAAHVKVRGGKATVTDGPFPETKEVVGGFVIVQAASREEAIELAKDCPHAREGIVEVWLLPDRDAFRAQAERKFLLLLHQRPDLEDREGAGMREMVAFDGVLKEEGSYLESSQLAGDPLPARVDARRGETLVTDGPFAESKEVVGGFYLVEAPYRAAAVEIAKRCPHAKWGRAEVREVMQLG